MADASCLLTRWQHFSERYDVIAAILKVRRQIENPTPTCCDDEGDDGVNNLLILDSLLPLSSTAFSHYWYQTGIPPVSAYYYDFTVRPCSPWFRRIGASFRPLPAWNRHCSGLIDDMDPGCTHYCHYLAR